MSAGDHLDDDPSIFHPLDRLVPGVDGELITNRLLDRDLAALPYLAAHLGLIVAIHIASVNPYATAGSRRNLKYDHSPPVVIMNTTTVASTTWTFVCSIADTYA